MKFDLSGLNPEQKEAAMRTEGPLLILAGPGSGKTRTITYRIAHMLINEKIDPKSILALSFTNKASLEMKGRVKDLVPAKFRKGIHLSTFHSLGLLLLREEIHHLGRKKNFTIYDSSDQQSIIREGLKHIKQDKEGMDIKTLMGLLSKVKNMGIREEDLKDHRFFNEDNDYHVALEILYKFYQDKLRFYNAIDFDDILLLSLKILEDFPEVAKKYSQRFQYIMIDEYQDTNELQFKMARLLTCTHDNICVVGDDDQSIYAFRGADITNILNFEQHYPRAFVVKLERNYRSTKSILNLSNHVIQNNTKRKAKEMLSQGEVGEQVLLWPCANDDHEAQIVIDEILKLQTHHGIALNEVAILYRSNTQVPTIEDQLRLAQIPYTIIGGQKFYEKKEIKDLIAYMSFVYNPLDEISLRRILNVPNRGIGLKTLQALLKESKDKEQSLFKSLKYPPDELKHKHFEEFLALRLELKRVFDQEGVSKGLEHLIQAIDYDTFIEKSYNSLKISARKKDDVLSFINAAKRFEERFKREATLEMWLERLLLQDSQDKRKEKSTLENNEVQLMTLHSSKGLEFDHVFLIGCEEELIPHKKTIRQDEDIQEERRLFYVGLTRARKKLIMTHAQSRKLYGKEVKRSPTRFLLEVDSSLYHTQDRNSFGHLSEEEVDEYKSSFFNDLLKSLD